MATKRRATHLKTDSYSLCIHRHRCRCRIPRRWDWSTCRCSGTGWDRKYCPNPRLSSRSKFHCILAGTDIGSRFPQEGRCPGSDTVNCYTPELWKEENIIFVADRSFSILVALGTQRTGKYVGNAYLVNTIKFSIIWGFWQDFFISKWLFSSQNTNNFTNKDNK